MKSIRWVICCLLTTVTTLIIYVIVPQLLCMIFTASIEFINLLLILLGWGFLEFFLRSDVKFVIGGRITVIQNGFAILGWLLAKVAPNRSSALPIISSISIVLGFARIVSLTANLSDDFGIIFVQLTHCVIIAGASFALSSGVWYDSLEELESGWLLMNLGTIVFNLGILLTFMITVAISGKNPSDVQFVCDLIRIDMLSSLTQAIP
jgi:hypothetical protein